MVVRLCFHARFWGLCRWGPFPGGRAAPGSSFLDLQSQVFSELHDSHPCTCLVCWASVRDSSLFSFSFHPLGLHAVALCPAFPLVGALQSQVHFQVSTLRSVAVLHCLQLFPVGLQLSAVTRRFVLLVPLELRSFLVDLVPRQLVCAFSQFPSASSSLSPCSLGCEALVGSRLLGRVFFLFSAS